MTQLSKFFLVIVGQSSLESDEVELLLETMILCNQCTYLSIQYLTVIVIVIVGHRSGISKLLYVPDQLAFFTQRVDILFRHLYNSKILSPDGHECCRA